MVTWPGWFLGFSCPPDLNISSERASQTWASGPAPGAWPREGTQCSVSAYHVNTRVLGLMLHIPPGQPLPLGRELPIPWG